MSFRFSTTALDPAELRTQLEDQACGACVTFEGWVRAEHEGRAVRRLEYEAYAALAGREGTRIVEEAVARYGVRHAACVHRTGDLGLGELAVWVGASAPHRAEAFAACRYIIDEVKHRVPIWKKEHYVDGDSGWVNCERCAEPAAEAAQGHAHALAAAAPDYSRQIALPEVGAEGQARIACGAALVVGAGGLGVPVLQYLAAAGVGRLGIVDADVVEASNLQRQPLYGVDDVGRRKAHVAAERLARLNPALRIEAHDVRLAPGNAVELLSDYDVVVECSDNFATKFVVNDAAVSLGKPAVYASVYQYEGQLQTYLPREDWPCLRCLWPEAPRDGLVGNCAEAGVLGPVPAALGALQAMQALKVLLGLTDAEPPAVHTFDLLGMHWHTLHAARRPACDHRPRTLLAAADDDEVERHYADLDAARASGLTLVDIREAWERAADPPGASIEWHVPLSELLAGAAALPPGHDYLLVCAHGVRSYALTEQLRGLGYRAYSLAGGLAALDGR